MRQASNSVASAAPAIDLKLRLTLRVAALAAICFIAVAAYTLFDSDRAARAKAGRIAEIVARDLSLQQSHAKWLSVSISSTPDLQAIAALKSSSSNGNTAILIGDGAAVWAVPVAKNAASTTAGARTRAM